MRVRGLGGEAMCLCICHLSWCLWGTLWLLRPECCPGTRIVYLQCFKLYSFDCVHMCALVPTWRSKGNFKKSVSFCLVCPKTELWLSGLVAVPIPTGQPGL